MGTMSSNSNEQQPLLKNGIGKNINWEARNGDGLVSSVKMNVDGLHNGLSRREKNGDSVVSLDGAVRITLPPPEREETRYPPEKWKAFMAFAFMSVNLTLNLTCLAIIHERIPDRTKYPPLPDFFFDLFPPADWALDVSEILIIVSVSMCLILLFLHKHRFIILRRIFFLMGLLYFMRSITMFVTQVPVASTTYYCSPKANATTPVLIMKRVFKMMTGFGLSINGQHTYCGDYIYSGHTVILTMSYLVIREYSPRRCWMLHLLSFCMSFTGIMMVLVSRGHYTIDIILAYYVTTRLFWIYHSMANNSTMKNSGTNNFLSRVWWFGIFTYMEKNVNGVIPRQYEWPLPWPRRFLRHSRIS